MIQPNKTERLQNQVAVIRGLAALGLRAVHEIDPDVNAAETMFAAIRLICDGQAHAEELAELARKEAGE